MEVIDGENPAHKCSNPKKIAAAMEELKLPTMEFLCESCFKCQKQNSTDACRWRLYQKQAQTMVNYGWNGEKMLMWNCEKVEKKWENLEIFWMNLKKWLVVNEYSCNYLFIPMLNHKLIKISKMYMISVNVQFSSVAKMPLVNAADFSVQTWFKQVTNDI